MKNGSGWFQVAVLNVSGCATVSGCARPAGAGNRGASCAGKTCAEIDMELGFAYYISETPRLEGESTHAAALLKDSMPFASTKPGQLTGEPEYIYININVFGKPPWATCPAVTTTGTLNLEVTY